MISVAFSNISDVDSKLQSDVLKAVLKHPELSLTERNEIIEI